MEIDDASVTTLPSPEALAAAVDRYAPDDAVFTADTGMSTTWAARFIEMRGGRELLGSFNLGSMANALPQALGAQALDRERRVVSLSGDGGLMMLLGDLRTAVTYRLPVVVVVFDNGSLGMVQLEQQGWEARLFTGPPEAAARLVEAAAPISDMPSLA